MVRAKVYLEKADWVVWVYIAVHGYYTYEILDKMRQIGANAEYRERAHRNLISGNLNNGLTYSNPERRESVWVTSLTSSAREFFNSIVHEIRHLQQHIANEMRLDENSEDVCYLSGDIAYALFPYCRELLCEHCREAHENKEKV